MASFVQQLTTPFFDTPPYYSGVSSTTLVPSVYPIAINGRPYMVDQKSERFKRGYEQRVRDSVDQSTAPGESAINPGGLWRRGEDAWHYGAGQQYADSAESKDYQFYKSKGINPWVKGQLSLLHATKLAQSSTAAVNHLVAQDGRVYLSENGDVRYTTNPYASTVTWVNCTGEPGGSCAALATNGTDVFLAFPNDGVRVIRTITSPSVIDATRFVTGTDSYYMLGFAKNYMFGAYNHILHLIGVGGAASIAVTPQDTSFTWVGVATGQNAVYAAGFSGKKSLIYKIGVSSSGVLDVGIVALELPTGEVVSTISGYLGSIILGTDKGVRYCSTDGDANLIAGPIIPTGGAVNKITSEGKYSWFTWTNYDGLSGGLGRLDLSTFTGPNTPAFATDLMYESNGVVNHVLTFDDKRLFFIQGVGLIAEDSANLVSQGILETGTYRWGIPDRKFVAKVDVRTEPLQGSVSVNLSNDHASYSFLGTFDTPGQTEYTFNGSDLKTIEASFKLILDRGAGALASPVVTRWMARAYAAPFRSQFFVMPVLLHNKIKIRNKEYSLDVQREMDALDKLISNPAIVTLQVGTTSHSVIVEDVEWTPLDSYGNTWEWEGTATITMRSVEN